MLSFKTKGGALFKGVLFFPFMISPNDFKNNELRFTYCGVPVIYRWFTGGKKPKLNKKKGDVQIEAENYCLSKELSQAIFARQITNTNLVINICVN